MSTYAKKIEEALYGFFMTPVAIVAGVIMAAGGWKPTRRPDNATKDTSHIRLGRREYRHVLATWFVRPCHP